MKSGFTCLFLACLGLVTAEGHAATWVGIQLCPQADGSNDAFRYAQRFFGYATTHTESLQAVIPSHFVDQTFTGFASATGSSDTWRVALTLGLRNYRRDSYLWSAYADGRASAPTMGAAQVAFSDNITVTGGTGPFSLSYIFGVHGTVHATANSPLHASFFASLQMPQGQSEGSYYSQTEGSTAGTITMRYNSLQPGAVLTPTLYLGATGWFDPIWSDEIATWSPDVQEKLVYGFGYSPANSVSAIGGDLVNVDLNVDFASTVHLDSVLVTDLSGVPIPGITISSSSGIQYPLDPRNQAAVPEPEHGALAIALALLGAAVVARRLQAPQCP